MRKLIFIFICDEHLLVPYLYRHVLGRLLLRPISRNLEHLTERKLNLRRKVKGSTMYLLIAQAP